MLPGAEAVLAQVVVFTDRAFVAVRFFQRVCITSIAVNCWLPHWTHIARSSAFWHFFELMSRVAILLHASGELWLVSVCDFNCSCCAACATVRCVLMTSLGCCDALLVAARQKQAVFHTRSPSTSPPLQQIHKPMRPCDTFLAGLAPLVSIMLQFPIPERMKRLMHRSARPSDSDFVDPNHKTKADSTDCYGIDPIGSFFPRGLLELCALWFGGGNNRFLRCYRMGSGPDPADPFVPAESTMGVCTVGVKLLPGSVCN